MASFRFLHLSDMHFKISNSNWSDERNRVVEEKGKTARDRLAAFISEEKMRLLPASDGSVFDYVFITGDVAFQTQYPTKEEVKKDKLINALKGAIPADGKERIFWAVGNHDMDRDLEHALDLFKIYYWDVTSANSDDIPKKMHCLKVKDEAFNLLILNTNSKTRTENKIDVVKSNADLGHVEFNLNYINEILSTRDKNLPTIAIGHHGMSWFSPQAKTDMAMVFDQHDVDFYLCGHDHRLGYARFDDSKKDIHQITCGGCLHDSYAVFSIIYGEYRNGLYHLIPYKFNIDGNCNWGSCDDLHRKLGKDNVFMRSDYEEMIRKCVYQLWMKNVDIDPSHINDLWPSIWYACLEFLKNQKTEVSMKDFVKQVAEIIINNMNYVQHKGETKQNKPNV